MTAPKVTATGAATVTSRGWFTIRVDVRWPKDGRPTLESWGRQVELGRVVFEVTVDRDGRLSMPRSIDGDAYGIEPNGTVSAFRSGVMFGEFTPAQLGVDDQVATAIADSLAAVRVALEHIGRAVRLTRVVNNPEGSK